MTYEMWVRRIGESEWYRLGVHQRALTYEDQASAERAARMWGRRSGWDIEVRDENGLAVYNENWEDDHAE